MTTTGRRRPTQADVARKAGVSQTTVSMVVTGRGPANRRVGVDVQARVLQAIDEIGYTVNPIAQRLVGGRTSIIGVYTYERVFPSKVGDFYAPFLEGIERAAEDAGVDLLMFTSTPRRTPRSLTASGVHRLAVADGCIFLGRQTYPEDLSLLLLQDFPFAFVGRRESPDGKIPYAAADYATATAEVTRHLLGLGHRRIVLLAEALTHESETDRADGYLTAMGDAGLAPQVVEVTDPDPRALIQSLMADGVTALLAMPNLARPVYAATRSLGLSLPDDLSVARLGEPNRQELEEVDWTGFAVPRIAMGAAALEIVLQKLAPPDDDAQPPATQVTIPCDFVTGSTTGAAS